jgi:hypothetical protein
MLIYLYRMRLRLHFCQVSICHELFGLRVPRTNQRKSSQALMTQSRSQNTILAYRGIRTNNLKPMTLQVRFIY